MRVGGASTLRLALVVALGWAGACGGAKARSLVIVEVTKDPVLPRLTRVEVTVAGIRQDHEGDGGFKLGFYLSADVRGPVAVTAVGLDGGAVLAHGTATAEVTPGAVTRVPLQLSAGPPQPPDGGAPVDAPDGAPHGDAPDGAPPGDAPPMERLDSSMVSRDAPSEPLAPPADAATSADVAGADGPAGSTPPAFGCPRDEALVACYTFDDDQGTTVSDGSGLANGGTTDAIRVRGVHGMGLSFRNGAQVVQVRNAPSLKLAGSNATIEAWVRPAPYPTDMALDFLVGKVGESASNGYALGLVSGKVGGYSGGSGQLAGNVPTGTWSHVAAVWGPDGLSLYHNGTRVGSFGRLDLVANDDPLFLGNRNRAGAPISPPYFAYYGDLDVVRIYSRARTAQEICADANRSLVGASCI